MVARHIPGLMVLGAVLAAYKLFGIEDFLFEPDTVRTVKEHYDYIVVGGGTAGAVVAARLAEDADKSILVLEAGGEETSNPNVDVPVSADTMRGSEMDWSYRTVPQRHACKGHNDQQSVWPSGKGLGGTSNINYMQYLRGSRHDYDEWSRNGATGWAYKDVLPYFIKSEDNGNGEYVRTVFHGFGGRLTVNDIELSKVSQIMTRSFKELGIQRKDTNGRSQYGYGPMQATIRWGRRWSTAKAFLRRCMHWPNLDVATHATVTKIIFEGKRATGVRYIKDGKPHVVKAKKEVILSAGTVGTTKLLLLSGVGPKNHLQAMKIPVVSDVPVGDNLQDHVMADGITFYTPYTVSITPARAENFFSSWAYTLYGGGMKASPRFREGTAFLRTKHQPPHIKYPLIGLHIVANVEPYNADQINVKDDVFRSLHADPPHRDGITIYPILLHPRSKGTIRLKSSNPEDQPLINPNYLSEDVDSKLLVEALHFIVTKLSNTTVFDHWDLDVNEKLLPQCASQGKFTDAYFECYVRHITLSGYSPVGTCRMGAAGDATAVVDPQLRVRGTKNLRVVDASVIPASMSGNTYATQVMIAEKGSDMIRDKDTIKAIKEYFKHLVAVKHDKMKDEEEEHLQKQAQSKGQQAPQKKKK